MRQVACVGVMVSALALLGCEDVPQVAGTSPSVPEQQYNVAINGRVLNEDGHPMNIQAGIGLNIIRSGNEVTMFHGGAGIDPSTPPSGALRAERGEFLLTRKRGEPWRLSRSLDDYGSLAACIGSLGVNSVGPVDYPKLAVGAAPGDVWVESLLIGTAETKRRVALYCTLTERDQNGHTIEFRAIGDTGAQTGSWRITPSGELLAFRLVAQGRSGDFDLVTDVRVEKHAAKKATATRRAAVSK